MCIRDSWRATADEQILITDDPEIRRGRYRSLSISDFQLTAGWSLWYAESLTRRNVKAMEALLGGGDFLAFDAVNHNAAIVAEQLHAIAVRNCEQRFRSQAAEIDFRNRGGCLTAVTSPAIEGKAALVAGGAGHDQIVLADAFDAADATLAEVDPDGFAEAGGLALSLLYL